VGTGLPAEFGFQKNMLSWPPRLEAIAGLLISPSRGLLLYTPVAAFGVWGLFLASRSPERRVRVQTIALGFSVIVSILFLSCYEAWHGALAAFGPRYMLESATVLFIFLPFVQQKLEEKRTRQIWKVLCVWSIVCHGMGAYLRWDLMDIGAYASPWTLSSHPFIAKPMRLLHIPLINIPNTISKPS